MNPQVKIRRNLSATNARNLRTLLLLSVFAPQDIGARIRAARNEAGLTQEELADLVGVSTRSLQGYEAGEVVPYRHMNRIADITRKGVTWLLHGDTEDDPAAESRLDRRLEHIEALLERLVELGERDGEPSPSPRSR